MTRQRAKGNTDGWLLEPGSILILIAGLILVGVIWVVRIPLRIWHTTGSDGQMHPDTATWIAYGVAGGLIMLTMMAVSIRAVNADSRHKKPRRGPKVAATWRDRVSELTATGMSWEDATAQASAEGFPKGRWD